MKKIIRNVLFGIIAFLSFFSLVKAEEEKEVLVPYENTTIFAPTDKYTNIDCGNVSLKYFDVKRVASGYIISLKDNLTEKSGSEELICVYDKKKAGSSIAVEKTNIKFKLNFSLQDGEFDYTFSLSKKNGGKETSSYIDLAAMLGIKGMYEDLQIISGGEFVDVNCTKTGGVCTISLKKDFYASEPKTFTGTIIFSDQYESKKTVHLKGILNGQAKFALSAGKYGNCSFDSNWTEEGNLHYYSYTGGNITLPICDAQNSADKSLQFYGWAYDPMDGGVSVASSNVCKNFANYAGGSAFNPDQTGIYKLYACYSSKPGITINTNGAIVSADSSWVAQGGDTYFIPGESFVTLPQVTGVSGLMQDAEFLGWQLNGTKENFSAGSVVPADGRVYNAIFSVSYSLDNKEYSYNNIYVGDTQVYSLSSVTFDGCYSSSSSYVTATFENGVCKITGVSASPENETIDVYGTSQGKRYVLKLKVLSKYGVTENGDNSEFIINFDYYVAGDEHDEVNTSTPTSSGGKISQVSQTGQTLTVTSEFCDEYNVIKTGKFDVFANYHNEEIYKIYNEAGFGKDGNGNKHDYYGIGLARFTATPVNCESKKSYQTICLDPTGTPPTDKTGSIRYVRQEFDNKEVEKAARVIAKGLLDNDYVNHPVELAGANIAMRIISFNSGDSKALNVNDVEHKVLFKEYQLISKEIKSQNKNNLNVDFIEWWDNSYKTALLKYLNMYYNASSEELESGSDDLDFGLTEVNFTDNMDGSTAVYSGKLQLPKGVKNIDAEGIPTSAVSGYSNMNFKADGTFEFTLHYNDITKLKNKDAVKIKLSFESESGALSVAYLKPKDKAKSAQYQRMIIFDDNQKQVVYLNFTAKRNEITEECDLSIYTYDALVKNPSLLQEFNDKDCCQFITDKSSDYYKRFCTQSCVKNTFAIACDPNNAGELDVYTVNEGYQDGVEKYAACIVDINKGESARTNTDKMIDAAGNKISLDLYSKNDYCRVSCKEDWDFSFSSFKNFTGENSIKAGSYFQINNGIFIGGSRTCVTTYIDVASYVSDTNELSKKMVDSYNEYSLYSTIKAALDESKQSTPVTYYEYKLNNNAKSYNYCVRVTNGVLNYNDKERVDDDIDCDDDYELVRLYRYTKEAKNGQKTSVDTSRASVDTRKYTTYNTNGSSTTNVFNEVLKKENDCKVYDVPVDGTHDMYPLNYFDDKTGGCTSESVEQLISSITYKDKTIADAINESVSQSREAKKSLENKANNMAACQNFYLDNSESVDNNTFNPGETVLSKDKAYGTGYAYYVTDNKPELRRESVQASYQVIDNKFAPSSRFQYEEAEYMSIINDKNYLVSFDEKNEDFGLKATDNNKCVDINLNGVDSNASSGKTQLCKNKVDTYTYKTNVAQDLYSNNNSNGSNTGNVLDDKKTVHFVLCQIANTSSGYKNDVASGKTDCANAELYYYDVNYIKQTLKNSSFYKNYGNWFVQTGTDIKSYSSTKLDAVKANGGNVSTDLSKWSAMAPYNVFPIKMTTRRNIYRYMYSFDNIGYFANGITRRGSTNNIDAEPDLGRIMGATNSIVLDHTHTCFYEVYEDVCKCCGNQIETSSMTSGNYKVTTAEHLSGYCSGNDCSKSDPTIAGKSAALEIYPSTVSLYELDNLLSSDTASRLKDKNWSEKSEFYVNGKTYTTNKGYALANEIQSNGENIYDDTPEYSFYLEPETLSKIREYNGLNGYSINSDNLKVYGETKVKSTDVNDFNVDKPDEQVTLIHYGSIFLEGMEGYVPSDYDGKTFISRRGGDNVCHVVSTDGDAAHRAYLMSQNSDCRWVDYIQYDQESGNYFRLAYK